MTGIFLALAAHRLSLVYELTDESLTQLSWWGLGRPEKVAMAELARTEVLRSLSAGAVGCGHVHVSSSLPNERGLTILAQPNPGELANLIEELGRKAGASRAEPSQRGDSALKA
jgi:hypothetical protein